MGPSSVFETVCPTHAFDFCHCVHSRYSMSVIFGVDLEAGLVSEKSKFRGAGIVGACLGLSWDVRRSLLIRKDIRR
jgi:hypothetical protein